MYRKYSPIKMVNIIKDWNIALGANFNSTHSIHLHTLKNSINLDHNVLLFHYYRILIQS